MKKPFIVLSAVFITLILVIIFMVFALIKFSREFREVPDAQNTQATTSKVQAIKTAKIVRETATTSNYTLDLSYPESSSTVLPDVYKFIQSEKNGFIENFNDLSQKDIEIMGLDRSPWNLIINTKVITSAKTVSYIIEVYSYTGGAHGITSVTSFTYDASNKRLGVEDIFKPDFSLYTNLSNKARAYFKDKFKKGEASSIDDGTKPEAQTFSTWYVTDSDIVFIFGQYSIGPYALGIQEFPLSRSANKDILQPAFQ